MSSLHNPAYRSFSGQLLEDVRRGEAPIDGQAKREPVFYIQAMTLGSGWAAVMIWDGMGFEEPWETGMGRYGEPEPAEAEAKNWAAAEGVEYRPRATVKT